MNAAKRVLVVDDDESIRDMVATVLAAEGYEARAAVDGAAALEALRGWPPDLILLDLKMPVLDGPGFVEAYRRGPAPRAPIVLLTAASFAEDRARQLDAAGWLGKPFDLDALLDAVRRHAR